jgi:NAD dependent epimerase/dehydratase
VTLAGTSALVTGAGGFISSHLIEELATQGVSIRAFVRYTSRADEGNLRYITETARANVEVYPGDLRDPDAVLDAMRGCRTVFHLGALIAIPYSYLHPREVVETNVLGTLNVLEAARALRPDRVIHVSTSEVYGTARFVPISENHPLQGQSPYSASKIGADKIAESYARAFDVPVVTVRPFNTFGPRQSARAIIPTIVCQALYRDELRLGALEPTRDFTYVTDTAAGMILAAEQPDLPWMEVNLGSGTEITIGDLARRIMKLIGRELGIAEEAVRLRPTRSEVERLLADNARAFQTLGWTPTVTLDDGLRRVIDWVRGHPDHYRPDEYQR